MQDFGHATFNQLAMVLTPCSSHYVLYILQLETLASICLKGNPPTHTIIIFTSTFDNVATASNAKLHKCCKISFM